MRDKFNMSYNVLLIQIQIETIAATFNQCFIAIHVVQYSFLNTNVYT